MSEWNESFLGQYQQFQGNEAEKKSAKLAEELAALQRKQAASWRPNISRSREAASLSPEEAREKRLLEHWAKCLWTPHFEAMKEQEEMELHRGFWTGCG